MDQHMDSKDQAKLGLSMTRHSLTTFSKRRPFSRKPSSWRHPGGTVSETEETDFSECDETGPEPELERRKPSHVHSFTFSSLSMFRSKQRHCSKRKNNTKSQIQQSSNQPASQPGKLLHQHSLTEIGTHQR